MVLFGTEGKCWIGDGWHRVMAAEQIDALDIPAEVRKGGRIDALKHALGANAIHGQRRSPADKRRCVELALNEFPNMTQGQIADLVGCSREWVNRVSPKDVNSSQPARTVTGADGKQYPSTRRQSRPATPEEEEAMYFEKEEKEGRPEDIGSEKQKPIKRGRPCNGMQFARMALLDLDQIEENDSERERALAEVKKWMALNAPDDPGKAMRGGWKAAGKSDRESFMEWTAGRGSDLPKGNYRKMQSVLESLKRLLRSTPNIRNDAATELREILEKLEAQS